MMKRGQITLFIVLGVIILAVAGLMIYYKSDSSKSENIPDLVSDVSSVNYFTQNCIKKVLDDGIKKLSVCDVDLLERYLENNIRICTSNFSVFQALKITERVPRANINLSKDYSKLFVSLDYYLNIKKDNLVSNIPKFYLEYNLGYNSAPAIIVGEEENISNAVLSRPSIAVDLEDNPHITADKEFHELYMYNNINGIWSGGLFHDSDDLNPQTNYIANSHIEIDDKNRAWVSAHIFRNVAPDLLNGEAGYCYHPNEQACGQMTFLIENVNSSPVEAWKKQANIGSQGWVNGNLALDPRKPDEAVFMTYEGEYEIYNYNGDKISEGKMFPGRSGEKIRFLISQCGVWHAAMGGFSEYSSAYQNSIRDSKGLEPAVWAEYSSYPEQGDDMMHISLGTDYIKPEVAYIAAGYHTGAVINIWDGSKMIFDSANLPVIDANIALHGNDDYRFAPQWTYSKKGGAFLCWTSSDKKIKIAYIFQDGRIGPVKDITEGRRCAMATDSDGNIHITYDNNGLKYRKLVVG